MRPVRAVNESRDAVEQEMVMRRAILSDAEELE